jgi:Xaa-Pro aminopeptidase
MWWLNEYHAIVADALGPLIDTETRSWLESATRPLTRG